MGLIAVTEEEVEDPSEDTLRSMLAGVFVWADIVLMAVGTGPGVTVFLLSPSLSRLMLMSKSVLLWFVVLVQRGSWGWG